MSFGNTSPLLGGSNAFQQVLQQAGIAQQSPNSAGFDPSQVQQLPPSQSTQGLPPMDSQSQSMQSPTSPTQGQAPMPQSFEAQTILDALANRLKHTSKIAEKKLDMGVLD